MKLLLTSGGIENQSMIKALRELLGKEFNKSNLVFVPTAANAEVGDKWWLISDLVKCKELGFKEIDIADIAVLPEKDWQARLRKADVIVFGGGNTSYLMGQIRRSGLAKILPELLKSRVYVGISAGSMITAPSLEEEKMQVMYEEPIIKVDEDTNKGLGLVDFLVIPHVGSPYFPKVERLVKDLAKQIHMPLYAIDDQTAVKVIDGKIEIVTEGNWKKFN